MIHPLLEDCSKLTNVELDLRIQDLSKKYFIAARMGQGMIVSQMITILDIYHEEIGRRREKAMKETINKDRTLDDLINID